MTEPVPYEVGRNSRCREACYLRTHGVTSQNTVVIFKVPVMRTPNLHTKDLIPPDAAN
jgi:hypothetical protein